MMLLISGLAIAPLPPPLKYRIMLFLALIWRQGIVKQQFLFDKSKILKIQSNADRYQPRHKTD